MSKLSGDTTLTTIWLSLLGEQRSSRRDLYVQVISRSGQSSFTWHVICTKRGSAGRPPADLSHIPGVARSDFNGFHCSEDPEIQTLGNFYRTSYTNLYDWKRTSWGNPNQIPNFYISKKNLLKKGQRWLILGQGSKGSRRWRHPPQLSQPLMGPERWWRGDIQCTAATAAQSLRLGRVTPVPTSGRW